MKSMVTKPSSGTGAGTSSGTSLPSDGDGGPSGDTDKSSGKEPFLLMFLSCCIGRSFK